MARVHFVKHARKDYPEAGIAKGDSYYWWKFPYGPKNKSKNRPTRQQLTQSDFLRQVYDIQDKFGELTTESDFESEVDFFYAEIEVLRDEVGERLDAMPEHLQDTSTSGELLQERIDALENWLDAIQNVDLDGDPEEVLEELLAIEYEGS